MATRPAPPDLDWADIGHTPAQAAKPAKPRAAAKAPARKRPAAAAKPARKPAKPRAPRTTPAKPAAAKPSATPVSAGKPVRERTTPKPKAASAATVAAAKPAMPPAPVAAERVAVPHRPVAAPVVVRDRWRNGKRVAAGVLAVALVGGGVAAAHEVGAEHGTFPTRAAVAQAPQDCVAAWNAAGNEAARGALPAGAIVRVAHVRPLPGTLMRGRPCAVTVAVPGTGATGAWVDGVQGQAGFVDVSGYPAARRYAAPNTTADRNATVGGAGTLTAR